MTPNRDDHLACSKSEILLTKIERINDIAGEEMNLKSCLLKKILTY